MNCGEVKERISALLDAALDAEEEARIREHLLECGSCRDEHEELAEIVRLIREAPADAAPDGFAEGVVRSLPSRGPRRIFWIAPLAAAACLLVIATLANSPVGGPPERGTLDDDPGVKVASGYAEDREDEAAGRVSGEPESIRELAGKSRSGPLHGDFRGPAGEIPPGMRQPADPPAPEKPAETAEAARPSPVTPAAPSPVPDPVPAKEEAKRKRAPDEPVQRKYLVCGMEPDSAAGVILAELNRLREGEDRRRSVRPELRERDATERLVPDGDGAPSRLFLTLTTEEIAMIQSVIPGDRFRRTNGGAHLKKDGARDDEADTGEAEEDPVAEPSAGAPPPPDALPLPAGPPAGRKPESAGSGEGFGAGGGGQPAPRPPDRLRVLIEFAR